MAGGIRYENRRQIWAYLEMRFAAAQHEVHPVLTRGGLATFNARIGYDLNGGGRASAFLSA